MSEPRHFAIVAGTLTGNRGSEAMVSTCIEQIRARHPDAVVHVLSYYPSDDLKEQLPPNVLVHSSTPARLVSNWLPGSLIAKLVPGLRGAISGNRAGIFELLGVDAVMDVAGVAFIDGREKFLPFNVLTLLPFLLHGVPVYKLSQAVGPITSRLNRLAARLVLPRLRFVAARGPVTLEHLRRFGLSTQRFFLAPDISFLLEPERHVPYADRPKRVALLPSSLVQGKDHQHAELLAVVADALAEKGYEVLLVAHSYRSDNVGGSARSGGKSFNNDLPVAREIARLAKHGSRMKVVGEGLNARQIKAEIGSCRAALTSRFHGMIAALGTATPVVVVGWSHKYKEVLESFGQADSCFDYRQMQAEALIERALATLEGGAAISARISAELPRVKASTRQQFDRMFRELEGEQESPVTYGAEAAVAGASD